MATRVLTFAGVRRISVTSRSGAVEVVGEDREDVEVEGARTSAVEGEGVDAQLVVAGKSDRLVLRCPLRTDVVVGTLSGQIEVTGRVGDLRATTSSGGISVATAATVDARVKSGRVTIGRCDRASVHGTSNRVEVGHAGRLEVTTGSGTVVAGHVGDARVRSVSGQVALGVDTPGAIEVSAVSGQVEITVPAGVRPAQRLETKSGHVRSDVASGTDGSVAVTTTSGTIRLHAMSEA